MRISDWSSDVCSSDLGSFALVPYLGRDFLPSVDAGQILMHARAKVGTRVEETAGIFADVQKAIRQLIPPEEIATLVDNVGMPVSGINMTYNNTGTIGPQAEIGRASCRERDCQYA